MTENTVERIVMVAWEARKSPKTIMEGPLCINEAAQIEEILAERSEWETPEQLLDKANAVYLDRAYEDLTSTQSQG